MKTLYQKMLNVQITHSGLSLATFFWCLSGGDRGPRKLMKTGLTLILVGHINFILGAIVHGSVLRHISNPTDHITTEYTLANIISVTSGLLVSLRFWQCRSCKAERWWTLRLNNCCMSIRTLPFECDQHSRALNKSSHCQLSYSGLWAPPWSSPNLPFVWKLGFQTGSEVAGG